MRRVLRGRPEVATILSPRFDLGNPTVAPVFLLSGKLTLTKWRDRHCSSAGALVSFFEHTFRPWCALCRGLGIYSPRVAESFFEGRLSRGPNVFPFPLSRSHEDSRSRRAHGHCRCGYQLGRHKRAGFVEPERREYACRVEACAARGPRQSERARA